jgi:hypothetical protein
MVDRVTEDEDLKDIAGRTILFRPVIIIEAIDGNRQQFRLHLNELDERMDEPRLYGIVLSDLIDHISAAYHRISGRDERDIRTDIMKVLRDEDRFKQKDPTRGALKGTTVYPAKN